MCKCKKAIDTAKCAKANVNIEVNVTKIVKYVCLAGVAIVGCIFGTKAWVKIQNREDNGEE